MGHTQFSGPLTTGDIKDSYTLGTTNYTANVGLCVLMQTAALSNTAGSTSVSTTVYLPQQSQILFFNSDTLATWSVVTASLTIGTPANATAYLAATGIGTAGRTALTFTGADLTNMSNIGTTPGVVLAVATQTTNTTGSTLVTIVYAQTTATYS